MMRSSVPPVSGLRRGLLAGAAVTTALLLSACGGDHNTAGGGSGMNHGAGGAPASAPANATFNDADVTFAQMMIPHHQGAIEMAAMAEGRAADARVKDLAGTIEAAQQPEIDTMTGWLTAWGRPAVMPGMSSGAMEHGDMPGSMSELDMTVLHNAKGAAFDKQFLAMMIKHHEGAVEMAQQEVAQGADPDAKALAQKMIIDQQAEIATMRSIQASL